jgi:hypothetical protein
MTSKDFEGGSLGERGRTSLSILCAVALAVRICIAVFLPNIVHPDETFQYLEQAHRLVFGNGLIPWEYIVGTRSWFFPGLLAGVMEIGRIFGNSPEVSAMSVATFMSVLSLVPVICGFLWGWRIAGFPGALTAGVLNAFWFEIVYFSPHAVSENLAADALVLGLYLVYPGIAVPRKNLFWGGVFLGLALILRVQLGPAIAVGAIAICGMSFRARYLPLIVGAAIPILLSGLLDALTWDWPFQSMALNLWVNVMEGVAAGFGRAPFYQYIGFEVTWWSGAFVLILSLAFYAGRRLPVLLAVAATIFIVHSLLAHKEYRFTYPALPLIMTLVGIGSAQIAGRLIKDVPDRGVRFLAVWGVPLFWIATSLILARSREFYPLWYLGGGAIDVMRIIDSDSTACGVAINPSDLWYRSGGYVHLREGIPLYGYDRDATSQIAAFNYIIADKTADFTTQGFALLQCWAAPPGQPVMATPVCLFHREGSCKPSDARLLTATPPDFLMAAHPEWFARPR